MKVKEKVLLRVHEAGLLNEKGYKLLTGMLLGQIKDYSESIKESLSDN